MEVFTYVNQLCLVREYPNLKPARTGVRCSKKPTVEPDVILSTFQDKIKHATYNPGLPGRSPEV